VKKHVNAANKSESPLTTTTTTATTTTTTPSSPVRRNVQPTVCEAGGVCVCQFEYTTDTSPTTAAVGIVRDLFAGSDIENQLIRRLQGNEPVNTRGRDIQVQLLLLLLLLLLL